MKTKIIFAVIGIVLLSVLGLLIGMNIGGNYDSGFEFLGGVGYEATGYLGAVIGALIGALLGIFAGSKLSDRRK